LNCSRRAISDVPSVPAALAALVSGSES